MLNVFTLASGRLFQEEIDSLAALGDLNPVWVDLDAPTPEEKGWIAQRYGLNIPDDIVDDDLEESARFYEEDNGELHIRSDFLIDDGETPRNVRVAFILFNNVLFSIHGEDLPVFRLLRLRARRQPAFIEDAKDVLLKLYDADAEYSADALEGIYDSLEKVSARVLKEEVNDQAAGQALAAIAREEDLNGRIRRNVMDTRRAVSFMMRSRMLNAEQFEEARQILRDIDSLDSHTAPPALLRVAATTTLVVLSFSMLNPVLAVRLQALGASNSAIGFFAMLPFLSIALMVPVMPAIFARLGVARAYRLGLALEAAATLGYASTEHYGLWCVLAALGGVGAAAAWNGTEALIAHNAPPHRRGRLMGMYQTGLGAALALGPFLPGLLGWSPRGLTLLAVGCLLLALVLALAPSVSRLRATREGAVAMGLVAAVRRVPGLVWLAFVGGVFEAGLASVTSAHAAGAGLSLAAAASIAGVLGVGSFAVQYPTGWIADHVAPRPVFMAVGVLLVGASLLFALSLHFAPITWVSAFLWGAVGGALYTLTMTRVAHEFAHSSAVAGAAAVITGYTAGGALAPAISGVVFDTLGVPGQAVWLAVLATSALLVAARMQGRAKR